MAFKKISNFHISGFRCFKQFLNIPSEEENVKRLLLLNRLIRIFIQGCKIAFTESLQPCKVAEFVQMHSCNLTLATAIAILLWFLLT